MVAVGTEGKVLGGSDLREVREVECLLLIGEPNLYKVGGGGGWEVREGDLVLTGKSTLCGGEDDPSLWEEVRGGGEREGDFILVALGKAMWGGTIWLFTGLFGFFRLVDKPLLAPGGGPDESKLLPNDLFCGNEERLLLVLRRELVSLSIFLLSSFLEVAGL